ncbi:MAG TPA: magnesium and cobalt transport protein CorA [Rudaea sp.]|jgi:magnesium transporter|nr:magnesium and cobalt transport protein CorA [Rudaea sp.]
MVQPDDTNTPMLVNCVAYGDGQPRAIALDEIDAALKNPKVFVWVGLHEPDESLLEKLQQRFGLHPLAIEDAHRAHQRTKIEVYGDSLFVAVHTAQMAHNKVELGETHLFLGRNYLVSVRHGASLSYAPARRACESTPELLALGSSYALYAVLDFIVDNYLPIVDLFQARLNELEHAVLGGEFRRHTIVQLYELKKELLRLQLTMTPLQDILSQLVRLYPGLIRDEVRPYFRDVGDHATRINETAGTMREMLTAAMDVNFALVGIAQNDVFKKISGWALLLTAPMMVASWYGMNFHDMPELGAAHAYPITLGATAALCILLYVLLKRAKWL